MLEARLPELRARAERLAEALAEGGVRGQVVEVPSVAGGGALPGLELPSVGVHVPVEAADERMASLRTGSPAVVARIWEGGLLFDVRTVREDEVLRLTQRIIQVLRG